EYVWAARLAKASRNRSGRSFVRTITDTSGRPLLPLWLESCILQSASEPVKDFRIGINWLRDTSFYGSSPVF
ncbi:MAG: hypothetical protein DRH50_14560, partial [Deltaproteobacteria bacterium]